MSEDLRILKKNREAINTRPTLFKKYLVGLQGNLTGVDVSKIEKEVIIELESRLDNHTLLLNEFDEVQGKIEMLVDEDELEKQITKREEFENIFFKLGAQGKKK